MRVMTLDPAAFDAACLRLEADAAAAGVPDLVVGIATGGDRVAARMFVEVPHVSVSLRRPSTPRKERAGALFGLLRRMPRRVADLLRMAEARILVSRPARVLPLTLPPDVSAAIAGARRVLVVDDAVDSGATLRAVLDAVGSVAGDREVRSAALTVTTRHPLATPDHALWREGVLIRFPWSKDYRQI